MKMPYLPKVSRRTTLQWLAVATAMAGAPRHGLARTSQISAFQSTPKGYGTDPDLMNPIVPWERTMTPEQLQLTAALADLILPGTDSAPSPSAVGVHEFVDEWISAPYPNQQSDRKVILKGLVWVDAEAKRRWGNRFVRVDDRRSNLLDEMATKSRGATPSDEGIFFQALAIRRGRCLLHDAGGVQGYWLSRECAAEELSGADEGGNSNPRGGTSQVGYCGERG